jgi:hypothetical protein
MPDDLDQLTLEQPATIGDVVYLVRAGIIEVMAEAALTSRTADNSLIAIANELTTLSKQAHGPRLRFLLAALAQSLIETEPGTEG